MDKKIIGLILGLSTIIFGCNNVVKVHPKDNNQKIEISESDLEKSENYGGIKSCQEGYDLAEKEIKDGKLKYIFGGVGGSLGLPERLEELYGIEIVKLEGIIALPNRCYNDVMYKEIQKKFGQDAFNKAME